MPGDSTASNLLFCLAAQFGLAAHLALPTLRAISCNALLCSPAEGVCPKGLLQHKKCSLLPYSAIGIS